MRDSATPESPPDSEPVEPTPAEAAPTEPPASPPPASRRRRVTTPPPPGSDPEPVTEPERHRGDENDDRLRADKPPHY